MFFSPYDKVPHLAATYNLHHKVLLGHDGSLFHIGISTDPFIRALFATGCHHPKNHEFGKVLCLGDQLHMIANIQRWHRWNIRIVSLVENLFHIVYSVSVDEQGNCDFLTSEVGRVLLAVLLCFLCHMTECCISLMHIICIISSFLFMVAHVLI